MTLFLVETTWIFIIAVEWYIVTEGWEWGLFEVVLVHKMQEIAVENVFVTNFYVSG